MRSLLSSRGTQLAPVLSCHEVNSPPLTFTPAVVSHTEGGWPKEVDSKQRDQVFRYIKKVEKSDDYLDAAIRFCGLLEEKVRQNVSLQIYEDYFDTEDAATSPEEAAVRTLISFPDPARQPGRPHRPVSGDRDRWPGPGHLSS